MFDEVTKTEGGKRVARRSAFLVGSTFFQILFVAFLIVAGERIRAAVKSDPVVDVKFVRAAAPKPPPPPPPAPARKKPPSDRPKVETRNASPMAMIQPKTVEDQIKPPDPNEPEDEGGSDDGVEGGVVGGVVGGQVSQAGGFEDAPKYMSEGFKKPELAEKNCFRDNFRLPPALAGFVQSVTVKFAVYPNGAVGAFQVMGTVPDQRIADAIRNTLTNCTWIPGADAQGKPIAIYVILPVRMSQ